MALRGLLAVLCLSTALFAQQRVPLHDVSSLLFKGKATLRIVQGGANELVIEGDASRLKVSYEDHLLVIEEERPWYSFFRSGDVSGLTCTVTLPNLSTLTLEGEPHVQMGPFKMGTLSLGFNGEGSLDLSIVCDTLDLSLLGRCAAKLQGSTGRLKLLAREGSLQGKELSIKDAIIEIEGSSSAELGSTDLLDVTIRGNGQVTYSGTPRSLHVAVNGSGEVSSAGAPTLLPQFER